MIALIEKYIDKKKKLILNINNNALELVLIVSEILFNTQNKKYSEIYTFAERAPLALHYILCINTPSP